MVTPRHGLIAANSNSLGGFNDLDKLADLRVRCVCLRDTARAKRDAWLAQVFPEATVRSFADNGTEALSRHPDGYDVIIFSGNDVGRIARFIKANADLVSDVVKICVTYRASVQRRAQALMAGFDDVYDCEKMPVEEALARTKAIHRRYCFSRGQLSEQDRLDALLNEYTKDHRLTVREKRILEHLVLSNDNFISYNKIQQLCADRGGSISNAHVKVLICNLRKKLKPGVRITAKTHQGYVLKV